MPNSSVRLESAATTLSSPVRPNPARYLKKRLVIGSKAVRRDYIPSESAFHPSDVPPAARTRRAEVQRFKAPFLSKPVADPRRPKTAEGKQAPGWNNSVKTQPLKKHVRRQLADHELLDLQYNARAEVISQPRPVRVDGMGKTRLAYRGPAAGEPHVRRMTEAPSHPSLAGKPAWNSGQVVDYQLRDDTTARFTQQARTASRAVTARVATPANEYLPPHLRQAVNHAVTRSARSAAMRGSLSRSLGGADVATLFAPTDGAARAAGTGLDAEKDAVLPGMTKLVDPVSYRHVRQIEAAGVQNEFLDLRHGVYAKLHIGMPLGTGKTAFGTRSDADAARTLNLAKSRTPRARDSALGATGLTASVSLRSSTAGMSTLSRGTARLQQSQAKGRPYTVAKRGRPAPWQASYFSHQTSHQLEEDQACEPAPSRPGAGNAGFRATYTLPS